MEELNVCTVRQRFAFTEECHYGQADSCHYKGVAATLFTIVFMPSEANISLTKQDRTQDAVELTDFVYYYLSMLFYHKKTKTLTEIETETLYSCQTLFIVPIYGNLAMLVIILHATG